MTRLHLRRHKQGRARLFALCAVAAMTLGAYPAVARDYDALPPSLKHAATLLERMGFGENNPNDDIAGRLLHDWDKPHLQQIVAGRQVQITHAPAVNWGDVPLPETSRDAAGRNEILLPRGWDQLDPRHSFEELTQKGQAAAFAGPVRAALAILHEYVHMDQDFPTGDPQFEDRAWQKTLRANIAWMRNTRDSIAAERLEPDSLQKVQRLQMLAVLFETLRDNFETGVNEGLKGMIAEDGVSGGLEWPGFDTPGSTNLDTVVSQTNANAGAFLQTVNDEIRRIQANRRQPFSNLPPSVSPTMAADSTTLTLEYPGHWGHLHYTIAGARLDPPTGSDGGKVSGRQYQGRITGNTLTLNGTAVSDNESAGPGSGDYYELIVTASVGKEHREFRYTAPRGVRLNQPFSISVPVEPGATSGQFTISLLEQNRNYGPHGWVVSGALTK